MSDYVAINRANWDSRVPHHLTGYDLDSFRSDPTFISDVVRFDQVRLGSVVGLDVVHLQCHLGTDTLSLARLGAASVTGLDFSPRALEAAARLARDCGADITYVESELYDAPDAVGTERFDLVYTGVGALNWLPDISRWARVVAALLRPDGRLFLREFHPLLAALSDPREDGLLVLEYPYFEGEALTFFDQTTYVTHEGELTSPETRQFNHGLGEIFTALTDAGLTVSALEEHRSVPWRALEGMMRDIGAGEYELIEDRDRVPLTYTLQALKRP
ncbi:MAG: class I SAM-dependent methyltransferase [Actinomycetota bacterium]|nr:class I SAM-dependent methyltransferase [Actinomycetota bacterium]